MASWLKLEAEDTTSSTVADEPIESKLEALEAISAVTPDITVAEVGTTSCAREDTAMYALVTTGLKD